MANSRLEKIGTIYSRTSGLIKSGAMKWVDRPLWYDLYEAFPPKEEPRFDRPVPDIPLRQIFYHEDNIRAMFHRNNKNVGTINLSNPRTKTLTQQFVDIYKKIENQYDGSASHEQIYLDSIEMLKKERELKKEEDQFVSLSTAFKEAQTKVETSSINIKDLFKK